MPRKLPLFILFFLISGCSTTKPTVDNVKADQVVEKSAVHRPDTSPELENIKDKDLEEYIQKTGVIFGRTDFQGVLETSYVKLLLVNKNDPTKTFQLHIGDKLNQQEFPWPVKSIRPGYFFLKLPVGEYMVSSITIPVASTMAVEESNISFSVNPEEITYVGTMRLNGTKEKIRLGGVPVIKPGFEYTAEVVNESDLGIKVFKERFPKAPDRIQVRLMKIEPLEVK